MLRGGRKGKEVKRRELLRKGKGWTGKGKGRVSQ